MIAYENKWRNGKINIKNQPILNMNLVLSEHGAKSLDSILSYLWDDECKDYESQKEEHGEDSLACRSHVWHDIQRLNKEVEFNLKKQQEKAAKDVKEAKKKEKSGKSDSEKPK